LLLTFPPLDIRYGSEESRRRIVQQSTGRGHMEKTVKFTIEKETKNTVKFNEVAVEGQAPIIGTLYVQKWFIGTTKEIEVMVRKPE
jgi:hypothetical protein